MYISAQQLFQEVSGFIQKLPSRYKFEIGNQMLRASFSIVLNIAEGSGKKSDKELGRYLDIALGSLYETLAGLDTIRSVRSISQDDFNHFLKNISALAQQIGGFKRSLD